MILFVLFTALALPLQGPGSPPQKDTPVPPEQVLAWQLEGLTSEEIRAELEAPGLTERPEEALYVALSAAGANSETIRVVRETKAPQKLWKLGLRLPKPTDYLYTIADALGRGDGKEALLTIENEAAKQPDNPDVHLIYAQLAKMAQDWITAYGQASEAVAVAPDSPYAHAQRSTACYYSRLAECAARESLLFQKLRPGDAVAYIVLGHARELQGKFDEALQAYAQAEKLHPGYSAIYAGRGTVFQRIGDFENSVKAYEQAIRLDANYVEYYCELADEYLKEGYAKQAIEKLKQAKALAPGQPDILLALGNAYLAGEQYSAAASEYKELLERAPDTEAARMQLAKALKAQGREEEAARILAEFSAESGLSNPR